jgi:signal transduction histidine kinase
MKTSSLRYRLLMLAALAVAAAMILSAIGLTAMFGRHVERRIGQELDTHILQLAGKLRFNPQGELFLQAEPGDPRFTRAFGGLYWQIKDETSGRLLRSVSLWDAELPQPGVSASPGLTTSSQSTGPDGAQTLVHERRIMLKGSQGTKNDRPVRITVAINESELGNLKTGFAVDLAPASLFLGLVLLALLWWQVNEGLKPVSGLGAGIRAIRSGELRRLSDDVPSEIQPLVSEVNELLDGQEQTLARARDRAADLAHGLKTPLTALSSDVARLRKIGQHGIADDIAETAARMRQIVERELARSRVRNAFGGVKPVPVAASIHAIIRTLQRTPKGEKLTFRNSAEADVTALADMDDFNDVIGNLTENATRAARAIVAVAARRDGARLVIEVSDDGDGVPEQELATLGTRGQRLDRTGGSAGLGLSIVTEILEAYGSSPEFFTSSLGGLGVRFTLPAAA